MKSVQDLEEDITLFLNVFRRTNTRKTYLELSRCRGINHYA